MENLLLSAWRLLFACTVFVVFSVFPSLQFIIPGTKSEKNFPSRMGAVGMREPDG